MLQSVTNHLLIFERPCGPLGIVPAIRIFRNRKVFSLPRGEAEEQQPDLVHPENEFFVGENFGYYSASNNTMMAENGLRNLKALSVSLFVVNSCLW